MRETSQTRHLLGPSTQEIKTVSYAGTDFVPRFSSMVYEAPNSDGCIKWVSGSKRAVLDLHLPSGATILGVKYQHYQEGPGESDFFLVSYPGDGSYNDILWISGSETIDFHEKYREISGGYVVDNYREALSLVWGPRTNQSLFCGATVYYQDPAVFPEKDYWFMTGQSLMPVDSSTSKEYPSDSSYAGCVFRPSGKDGFSTNVDLPKGTKVAGYRVFYHNKGRADFIGSYLQRYDGRGSGEVIGSHQSTYSDGFASEYHEIKNGYLIDPEIGSYSLIVHPGATIDLAICGIRLWIAYPENLTKITKESSLLGESLANESQVEFTGELGEAAAMFESVDLSLQADRALVTTDNLIYIAGSSFHPIDSEAKQRYSSMGCVYTDYPEDILTTSVTLPQSTYVKEIRYLVNHPDPEDISTLYITAVSKNGYRSILMDAIAGDVNGYGTVSNSDRPFYFFSDGDSLSFVWESKFGGEKAQLCGAQLVYDYAFRNFLPAIMR